MYGIQTEVMVCAKMVGRRGKPCFMLSPRHLSSSTRELLRTSRPSSNEAVPNPLTAGPCTSSGTVLARRHAYAPPCSCPNLRAAVFAERRPASWKLEAAQQWGHSTPGMRWPRRRDGAFSSCRRMDTQLEVGSDSTGSAHDMAQGHAVTYHN